MKREQMESDASFVRSYVVAEIEDARSDSRISSDERETFALALLEAFDRLLGTVPNRVVTKRSGPDGQYRVRE